MRWFLILMAVMAAALGGAELMVRIFERRYRRMFGFKA